MNKFYVYEWYNLDTGEVFYVGKGTGKRYKLSAKSARNIHFINYINKYKCDVRIVCKNLTEEEAFNLEIQTIIKYKNIGQCTCNYTCGGDGISGYKHTEETKNILSENHKGDNNSQYGISPKERMGDNYDNWIMRKKESIKGSSNPNYGNNKLKLKYEENPHLAQEKQARKGSQNGKATRIQLYDEYMNFIKEFGYIGLCCEYLHKYYEFSDDAEVVRVGIRRSIKYDKPYKGFKFIKIKE